MSKIHVLSLFFLLMLVSQPQAKEIGTVVLDPGHGGYEFGLSAGTLREKDLALSITKKLRTFLKDEGKEVFLTREIDRYLSISDRRERIDSHSPDIFLSLHLSDSEDVVIYVTRYKESEAELSLDQYYSIESRQRRYLYESRVLANTLGSTIGSEFGVSVKQRELPLPLLSGTGAPAVLVEIPSKRMSFDENTKQRIAYALGIGLQIYEQR